MSNAPDELQAMWLAPSGNEEERMTLAEIRDRANRIDARVARRNRIEYIAGGAAAAAYVAIGFLSESPIVRLGAIMCALGGFVVMWQLHRQARSASREEYEHVADRWIDFHRAMLVRQRDALRSIWSWYLGPLVPGLIVFTVGIGEGLPAPVGVPTTIGVLVIIGVIFQAIARLNRKAAARLQAEIDLLDGSQG
ncbi:hypothetical protein [Sphingosinicella rhizophila]|uniref:Uncharacterized protein n=1 Tax=Sphingosinicella rhizophila TaxID=3050082 RepID=A0ABU3QAR3_9SPHN|nr:hypothetical protein [Sphingosinicella sp. GR2756]MDT9600500.1 hypothetical protein [Sphingosinicella sp. GR2756]